MQMQVEGLLCLTTFDAKFLAGSHIVYGIGDKRTSKIVYVGKTRRPMNRVKSYRYYANCHNRLLKEWLEMNGAFAYFEVLYMGHDVDKQERHHIAIRRKELLNLSGGYEALFKHISKPWMAGMGIRCPSAFAFLLLSRTATPEQKEVIKAIRALRKRMTLFERALFEINVCRDLWGAHAASLQRWLDVSGERIIATLSAGQVVQK